MRLRKIKNALEKLQANTTYFVSNPTEYKGNWKSLFGNDNPIHIEIGCGKGQFMSTLAKQNPNINYVAIEKFDSVLLRCLEKVENEDIPNLKLTIIDAMAITNFFGESEVDRIYLNFSDPWPKNAHSKRRLTSPLFLEGYANILSKDGEIHQKTDNRHLFEFSLESLNNYGMILSNISLDLHNSDFPNNIMTEYEEKFSKFGPIYRLEARFK